MKDPQRPAYRIAAPIKNLAQRFAYMGLVLAAFALMLLGKADTVLVERVRAHVTDAVAPILDVLSRPVATANEAVERVRELVDLRAENQRLRQEKARLLLITDLNSHIPVLIESSGTRAILAGNNTDRPRLIRLPPRAAVTPGERIVTSGHGGVFPPRLPVGVVASVSESGIRVQPFVERNRLEYVRVVDFGLSGILELPQSTRPAEAPTGGGPAPQP